jgi:protein-tyrosine phosphatase
MVDIHSHVLPGVDDGSRSMEESMEMLRMAAEAGTTDIVATPHASPQFPFDAARVREAFRELSEKCRGLIQLHLGCDFHLTFENVRNCLEDPSAYTVNGKSYLMVELPDLTSASAMRAVLRRLISAGIVPVITHPERNPSLQPNIGELEGWVKDGCLLQVTGQSLLGLFGPVAQRAAETLLQQRLVHFVASDAHDTQDRTPDLRAAFQMVRLRHGEERAQVLFRHNPYAVVCGERFISQPVQEERRAGWRAIFGRGRNK